MRAIHARNAAQLSALAVLADDRRDRSAGLDRRRPRSIGRETILPALWAVISFSIFIASMMHRSWPSSTISPALTSTFHMLPCSGASSVSGPPLPLQVCARSCLGPCAAGRRGAVARAAIPPPGERRADARARRSACPRPRPRRSARPSRLIVVLARFTSGAAKASVFSHSLSSSRSRQVSPRGPLLGRQQRLVERDQRLQALDLVFVERAQHALRRPLAVGVPYDQLGDHRVVHRRDLAARARRPSRCARPARSARGSAPILPGAGGSPWTRPRR